MQYTSEYMKIDSRNTGDYYVMFLSRHQNDNHLYNNTNRWLTLWYEYQNDKYNVPIYRARILFGPKRKSDPKKYIH